MVSRSRRLLSPALQSELVFRITSDVMLIEVNGNRVIRKAKENHPDIISSIDIADFFKFDPPKDQLFDLIYDHT